mmetsp:Transcript_25399/g.68189  ORF Transcript_25399/g.68189 Transcript_25399/m.68189 type:complete len:241 (+) Transcript_25399:515-1237(+)
MGSSAELRSTATCTNPPLFSVLTSPLSTTHALPSCSPAAPAATLTPPMTRSLLRVHSLPMAANGYFSEKSSITPEVVHTGYAARFFRNGSVLALSSFLRFSASWAAEKRAGCLRFKKARAALGSAFFAGGSEIRSPVPARGLAVVRVARSRAVLVFLSDSRSTSRPTTPASSTRPLVEFPPPAAATTVIRRPPSSVRAGTSGPLSALAEPPMTFFCLRKSMLLEGDAIFVFPSLSCDSRI